MKRLYASVIASAVILSVSPAFAQSRIALPVAEGAPGNGPWVLGLWPEDACEGCAGNEADAAAVEVALVAILNNDATKAGLAKVAPRAIRGAKTQESLSVAALSRELSPCEPVSKSLLSRVKLAGPGTSLGVAFQCPGHKNRGYLSVSVFNGRVSSIYWLPGEPIYLSEFANG